MSQIGLVVANASLKYQGLADKIDMATRTSLTAFQPFFVFLALMVQIGCAGPGGSSSSNSATPVSPLSQDFDASTNSYKLNYTISFADEALAAMDSIDLRELDMTVYTEADLSTCASGIPVKSWIGPFTADQKISGFYLAGSQNKFRYVLCTNKKDGTFTAQIDGGAAAVAQASQNLSAQSTSYTATKVTSGQYFTCALFSNGRVKCWGNNQYGQLGIGNTANRGDQPNEMGSNLAYVDLGTVTTGSGHTLTTSNVLAIDISAGLGHVCAVTSDGRVKCWGHNDKGQLGYGDTATRGHTVGSMGNTLGYVNLGTGVTVKAISAGGDFTCAILNTNQVKCWGDSASGPLGRGNTLRVGDGPNEMGDLLPILNLGSGRTVKAIAAGLEHACAILDNNQVKCWGINDVGQLGIGDTDNRGDEPGEMGDQLPTVDLGNFFGIPIYATSISAGASHTCVSTWTYQMKCWGDNFAGQLGIGSTLDSIGGLPNQMGNRLPQVDFGDYIMGLSQPVLEMQVGFYTTCAQLYTSEIKCWGANHYGQLGIASARSIIGALASDLGVNLPAVNIGTGNYVKMFSSQYGTTCSITQDNVIKCWGVNTNGALGYGDELIRGGASGQMGSSLPVVDL